MKPILHYYNFRTKQYDALSETPADWSDYIPQVPPAQNLYNLHLKTGKTPADAALEVLKILVGHTEMP